jgi:hypothetical protein
MTPKPARRAVNFSHNELVSPFLTKRGALMKSSMMALAVGAALAGCSTGDGNMFAARDKTVEYYRVFDIKTDPGNPAVVKAASDGISRHVSDAALATPAAAGGLQEQPGRFKLAVPTSSAPGTAAGQAPNCEGASWTAKGAPRVNGGDNMNVIACLFPYKNGYHLDMYAVFTKKEGGWLEWPRRAAGRLMGTPETWTDQTMVDVVRAIHDATGAQVALVEAKPGLNGMPWMDPSSGAAPGTSGAAPGGAPGGAGAGGSSGSGSGAGAAGGTASTGGATTSSVPNPATGTCSGATAAPPVASSPVAGETTASASTPASSGTNTTGKPQ